MEHEFVLFNTKYMVTKVYESKFSILWFVEPGSKRFYIIEYPEEKTLAVFSADKSVSYGEFDTWQQVNNAVGKAMSEK